MYKRAAARERRYNVMIVVRTITIIYIYVHMYASNSRIISFYILVLNKKPKYISSYGIWATFDKLGFD